MSISIHDELYIDVNNIFGQDWSVKDEDLVWYDADIHRAAEAVEKIRTTGKGPNGVSVLFPHLPYLLDEDLLISEEEKENLLSLGCNLKSCHFISRLVHPHPSSHTACAVSL